LVVCYHTVSAHWPVDFAVTPSQFTAQLQSLVERGYRAVTFSEAALGDVGDEKVVAITFDDGYASVAEVARPILDSFGMQATVFLPTDFIGNGPVKWTGGVGQWIGTEHEPELMPMSWEQVRSLDGAGWEVGSHTKSHPSLIELSDAELEEELTGSRSSCEQMLDRACRSLAFPYGDHDARVIAATERAGYVAAATVLADVAVHSPLRWPRIAVSRFDGGRLFRIKTSRTVRGSSTLTSVARGLRLFNKRAET
jgi:peptidoglycan/xylan/chitin deacetylase (PgdA/CDA1 family)